MSCMVRGVQCHMSWCAGVLYSVSNGMGDGEVCFASRLYLEDSLCNIEATFICTA